jgi:site-specific DNA recombinase
MFLKIIGIFAEFERENIIERTKVGIERKVREGFKIGGSVSYGYDMEKNQKIQTINEQEAEIVREVFDMYVNQGASITAITRRLNTRKIPTKQNTTWGSTGVRRLLANVNYVGEVRHHIRSGDEYAVEGQHEAIISEELFDNAQALLANNKKVTPRKQPREDNYFSGFLVCGSCGYKMGTQNSYKTLKDSTRSVSGHYRCQHKLFGICKTSSISHKKLEIAFEEYINKIADFDIADDIEIERQKNDDVLKQIQAYENKLRQMEYKERETLKLYVENEIEFDSYREVKKLIDKEKAIINAELANLREKTKNEPLINKADIIKNFRENWSLLTVSERRHFLLENVGKISLLVEKIEGKHYGIAKIQDISFLPSPHIRSKTITL